MMNDQHSSSREMVEAREASTEKNIDQDIHLLDVESGTFVVPTKGSDAFAMNSDKHEQIDAVDSKTVTTASDSLTIDGISDADGTYVINNRKGPLNEEIQNKRTTPYNGLDWSFLRGGELFDREEQKTLLLDAFYRELNVDFSNTNEDISQKNQSVDDQEQSTIRRRNKEFVIVSGLSGTGKTKLVEETLKRPVTHRGGYFLCGKLDQLNKDKSRPQRPYAPFVMAFSNFADSVTMNQNVAEEIRACVCSKMTDRDIDLILETFPSLGRIIRPSALTNGNGSTVPKDKMNGADNQLQLAIVVRTFLDTVCDQKTRPIVLLIDDLQWADQGTLVLLRSLLSETSSNGHSNSPRSNGLLVVGTCRHNEVTVEDELAVLLRNLEDEENVDICQIEVSNLSRPICGEIFGRVLGIAREDFNPEIASSLDPLIDIAYKQTNGNPFFFLQFIRSLHDEGYLQMQTTQIHMQEQAPTNAISPDQYIVYDDSSANDISEITESYPGSHRSRHQPNTWLWSEEDIRGSQLHATSMAQDAVSIIAHQMKQLPLQIQETLMVASCLGSKFDKKLLQWGMPTSTKDVSMYPIETLSSSLELLIEKDWVSLVPRSGHYQFCHDKIQQAAIILIPDDECATFCTNIGRRINGHAGSNKDDIIFLIVNLLSHGISAGIITDRNERKMIACLLLEAGETAASMSDFVTAATYLNLGITCLPNNYVGTRNGCWKAEYNLSLKLYNVTAEVEYCNANFERMDYLIKEILLNARDFHDKLRAYVTMINSLGSRERLFEAIAQGFSLLEVLGEPFHSKDLKIFLLFDLIKTKKMLKKFDCDLEQLPQMKDRNKISAMQILNLVFPYCLMLKHPKAPFAIFRMVQLTVKYGLTPASATGFAGYGLILCGIGDFLNGNINGKIALRLLQHFDAKHLYPRVYAMYYGFISNWNTPLAMNLEPLMDGHKLGLSTGDIEFAMVNASLFATTAFHSGQPLDFIESEVGRLQELTILFRQTAAISVISPILQQVYNLRAGRSFCENPWILSGKACDEEDLMSDAEASNNVMCLSQFNYRKLWMAYVFNNYKVAFAMAKKSRVTMKSSPASFMVFNHYFFEGMTCMALALCPETKVSKKKGFVRLATGCLKAMKKAVKHCKRNCLNKFLMLEAELLIMKGNLGAGLKLFEKSASISEEEGFIHEQAIAYERAGFAVLHANGLTSHAADDIKRSETAGKYFSKSILIYQRWGARTKVDQLIAQGH